MANGTSAATKFKAQDLISALRACPQATVAWVLGISNQAVGQAMYPRNDDPARSYDLHRVVEYAIAKARTDAIEQRGGPKGKGDAQSQLDEARTVAVLIENGKELGELLHRADVETAITRAITTLKQNLEASPSTWVPELVGKTDVEMKDVLRRKVWALLVECEKDLNKAFMTEKEVEALEDAA